MPLQLVDFWKRMVQSGLADASDPPIWAADFANDHGGKPPSDPVSLASWLVKTGRVKKYPISRVLQHTTWEVDFPNTPLLRIPPLTLVAADKSAPFPFSDWQSVVCDPAQAGAKPVSGWMRQINPAGLPAEAAANLRAHAELSHPALQPIEIVPVRNGPLGEPIGSRHDFAGVFTPLASGRCLDPPDQPRSVQQTVAVLDPICDAVAAMHAKKMVHGDIHRDRIWANDSGQWTLLRDPFASMQSVAGKNGKSKRETWLDSSPDSPSHWSPERLAGSQNHELTVADDIFAIGCLGFELRFGRPAFANDSRSALPSELTTAVEQGATGDPLCRVLAAALATDPNARFASVEQFAQALNVAATATPVEPETEPAPTKQRSATKTETITKRPTEKTSVVEKSTEKKSTEKKAERTTSPAKPKTAARETAPKVEASKPTPQNAPLAKPSRTSEPGSGTSPKKVETPSDAKAIADAEVASVAKVAKEALVERSGSSQLEATAGVASVDADPEADATPLVVAESEVPKATAPVAVTHEATKAEASTATPEPKPTESKQNVAAVVPVRRRRRRRNRKAWYGIYALCVPVLVLVAMLATRDKNPREVAKRVRPPVPQFIPRVSSDTNQPTTPVRSPVRRSDPPAAGIQVVDNEQMLWAPPDLRADGEQVSRATGLLPPGPAAVVTMDWQRLQQLGLLEMFGPETQSWLDALNQWSGVPSETIAHVALAWFPGEEGIPEVAAAIRLNEPKSLETLLDTWGVSSARGPGGETIYAGDTRDALAYFPMTQGRPAGAADDLVDAFAVGSIARIGEVAEMGGAPVVLPRLLEELWQSARPNDAIAFLTQPNFLVSDARRWMDATSPELIPWIRQNLLADCGGVLVRVASASEDSFNETSTSPTGSYVEVRLAAAPGVDPTALATPLRAQLDNAPRWAEDFLVTRDIDPSWRLLAARLPSMWAFAQENVRTGRVDRKLVWNAYLPPLALPQLTLATLLATNTTTEPVSEAMASNQTKLSIEEMLDRKMSVSFDQESLQFAVDTIAEEFNRDLPANNQLPPIEIIGGDLQKMGITQNQQIRDFAKNDIPLRTVLTDLVLGANPDRTATGPADPKQALVWVVKPDKSAILITTRLASDGQYELPSEFVSQASP
ncbi:protein kinase family protein [Rhodopirellula baltica]